MRNNYIQFSTPQFRLLSDNQLEELHLAILHILEKTGVSVDCQEAIDLLAEAGVDVSNPKRVRIPSHLVEQALRTVPKSVTLYTREGEPAIVLNGMTGAHFGGVTRSPDYLDPYTQKRRQCYVDDIADMSRLIDALPNIEWLQTGGGYVTLAGAVAEKVALLQSILNSSKPVACGANDAPSAREILKVCSLVAGGEKELQAKPFFIGLSEPVSPLMQGKEAMEKSLVCAEKGIPNAVFSIPMGGATAPATLPGILAIGIAEWLSYLVVVQLKKPGAPLILGTVPGVMDMKTTILTYGMPEMSVLVAALKEMGRYYKVPTFGTAGSIDAEVIDAQAGAEASYQILMNVLSGADMVHDVGFAHHVTMVSPELIVLADEIIDAFRRISGLEINGETLPLDLIESVGPGGNYLSESHTLKHFRKFWVPTIFNRSFVSGDKHCGERLNEKTLEILKTYKPKPLPEDLVKELKEIEAGWFREAGLDYVYPTKEV